MSMSKEQFKELQLEIQKAMNTIETLQSIYINQTGRRFVSGQRIGEQKDSADKLCRCSDFLGKTF